MTNYGQSSSHAYLKWFSLSFSYILFSCRKIGSVQIPSGFEVNWVVFMCVRASLFVSVWTCKLPEIHVFVFVCLSVCCKKYIHVSRAVVLFHFNFLLTLSAYQVGTKLKGYSFGLIECGHKCQWSGESFSTTILYCNANDNYTSSPSHPLISPPWQKKTIGL